MERRADPGRRAGLALQACREGTVNSTTVRAGFISLTALAEDKNVNLR